MSPTLTVVTITFNDIVGFLSTSRSFGQIRPNWEWIVVDGSTDSDCKEIVKKVVEEKGGLLLQEPDNGRFDAMNKGLARASGEIVIFMNGGDQFFDAKVPDEIIESYDRIGWEWAVGQAIAVDEQDAYLWSWPFPKTGSLKLKLGIRSYCHQATAVKVERLKKLKGFDISSLYSDWAVSLVLEKENPPYIVSDTWAKFLAGGISGQQSLSYWYSESIRIREKYGYKFSILKEVDQLLQLAARLYLQTSRGQLLRPDLERKYG